jgi:hypothetical protein
MWRFQSSVVGFGGVDLQVLFIRVDLRVLFILERPSLTGLTGAAHRSDQCRGCMGFASGERLGVFPIVPCCCCFEFGQFWSMVGLFGGFGTSWLELI